MALREFVLGVKAVVLANERGRLEALREAHLKELAVQEAALADAQDRAGTLRYSDGDVESLFVGRRQCGRTTEWMGLACTHECPPMAPACIQHLAVWEWNLWKVAERAWVGGWENARKGDTR